MNTAKRYSSLAKGYDVRWHMYLKQTHSRLMAEAPLAAGQSLLDVGCGTGLLEERILSEHPTSTIAAVDYSEGMLNVAERRLKHQKGVRLINACAPRLPFKSLVFDGIVCANTLHYIIDLRTFLGECFRVLKPKGWLTLVDWSRDALRMRLLELWIQIFQRRHIRIHALRQVKPISSAVGFKVMRTDVFQAFPAYHMMTLVAFKMD